MINTNEIKEFVKLQTHLVKTKNTLNAFKDTFKKEHSDLYNEIDFYTSDGILLESKYNSELTEKQEQLFNMLKAKKKIIIDSIDKLEILKEL